MERDGPRATHPPGRPAERRPASATERDPRWRAVLARDPAADGAFVYAVRTTGVYARPSSASRLPRPENVEFFDTPQAAEAAGYRPSRRRAGDRSSLAERHAGLVARACDAIDRAERPPGLRALAGQAGLSPYHFHRVFKAATGLTPREYAEARRAQRVRGSLAGARTVTEAVYDAGFQSNGRFYAASDRLLGMPPAAYRAGGRGADIRFAVGQCALGAILVASSARGVCAIFLGDDPDALVRALQDQFPSAGLIGGDAGFERLVARVVAFVESPGTGLDLPLDVQGTAFQQRVWRALRDIPAGATASYAEIAARIGEPQAARAVARACAANRLAVAIPCHRVVRRDGSVSGYRWGVARKQALLAREGAQAGDARAGIGPGDGPGPGRGSGSHPGPGSGPGPSPEPVPGPGVDAAGGGEGRAADPQDGGR